MAEGTRNVARGAGGDGTRSDAREGGREKGGWVGMIIAAAYRSVRGKIISSSWLELLPFVQEGS